MVTFPVTSWVLSQAAVQKHPSGQQMAPMELKVVTHWGHSQQVSWNLPAGQRMQPPLGRCQGREQSPGWQQPALQWPPLASLFSVFMIFYKVDFCLTQSRPVMGKTGWAAAGWNNRGRLGVCAGSTQVVLRALMMTFHIKFCFKDRRLCTSPASQACSQSMVFRDPGQFCSFRSVLLQNIITLEGGSIKQQ